MVSSTAARRRPCAAHRPPKPQPRMTTLLGEVGDRGFGAFDLAAVHAAYRILVEFVAAVHRAVVAPDQDVAQLPLVLVDVARLDGVLPQLVEQRFGFRN